MRFAAACAVFASVLALAGVTGLLGSWAIPTAAVTVLVAATTGAIALENRDVGSVRGLLPAAGADDEVSRVEPAAL